MFAFTFIASLKVIQEYQENEAGLVIDNVEINQVVNLFGCKNSTIQIKGKINAVTLGKFAVHLPSFQTHDLL